MKKDSAKSFEEYAFANFGSAKSKLVKSDSAKSDGLGDEFDPASILGGQKTWLDYLLCRSPKIAESEPLPFSPHTC